MLFTDATISTPDDLLAYESEVQQVAAACGIDLDVKLQRAQTEIGLEVRAAMARSGDSTVGLDRIVVTDGLKLWHTFHALAIVYADTYNRKLNDKYLVKWNEYKALDKWARNLYYSLGAGVVTMPIPAPGRPAAHLVSGGSFDETIYLVRVTWIDARGAESAPSPAVSVSAPAGTLPAISVRELSAPASAAGWFPYVGTQSSEERRQVSVPVEMAADWTMPASGLISGPLAGEGQAPDYYRQLPRVIQRG